MKKRIKVYEFYYNGYHLRQEGDELRVSDKYGDYVFPIDRGLLRKHNFRLESVAQEFMVLR